MRQFKTITAIVLSLIMAITVFPAFASAASEGSAAANTGAAATGDYEPGQIIVVTEKSTSKSRIKTIAEKADGDLNQISTMKDGTKLALVEVEEGSEFEAASALAADDDVVIAQPNYKYELEGLLRSGDYPNDPYYQSGKMEYLKADPLTDENNAGSINAAGAWEQIGNTELPYDERILVGVIDTGLRLDHEDLQGSAVTEKCVTYNKGEKMGFDDGDGSNDDIGHGSCVTGIIAANINNDIGVAGIAGGRAKAFVVDAGDSDGGINTIDLALGVYYCTDQGARLINMSVGGHSRDMVMERALKYAWDNDVLVICAAGNEGSAFIHYPSDSPYAVAVMSSGWKGDPSSFTCYGIDKDISAPGESLATTGHLRKTSYESFDGTSGACPVVTGAAALLLSEDPSLTPREIKNLLYTSTGKTSFSAEKDGQGFGIINLDTAMRNLRSEKTIPEKIVLNKKTIDMYVGQDSSVEYAVYPGNTNSADATFTSGNENIAAVDKDGVIVAKAPGKTTVTVSCKGASTVCAVTVKEIPYTTVDRMPYYTTGTFTMNELLESFPEMDEEGQIVDEDGFYYYLYRMDLEKGETIQAIMNGKEVESMICIKDMDGNILAIDDFSKPDYESVVSFTAEETGTYQLMAIQVNGDGSNNETDYYLKIASDKVFCQPKVTSSDYGQLRMSWTAAGDEDCYLVRKYSDKALTQVVSETYVDATKYVDTEYDSSKVGYYTVTPCVQTIKGIFFCGESPLVVKMSNPMSVKGKTVKAKAKTLKKKKVTLKRAKALTVSKAQGKVTYAKVKGSKKITIDKKTGKVTLKKKLKKGKYKVKVKVRAAGNDSYNAAAKIVTFTVKVK